MSCLMLSNPMSMASTNPAACTESRPMFQHIHWLQVQTKLWDCLLYPAAMRRLPMSMVTLTVPIRTISMTLRQAFTERRSVGQIKLPAALLITMVGSWPSVSMHSDTASRTELGSRTSHFTATTCNNNNNDNYDDWSVQLQHCEYQPSAGEQCIDALTLSEFSLEWLKNT